MAIEPQSSTQDSEVFYPISSAGDYRLPPFFLVFLVFCGVVGTLVFLTFWYDGQNGFAGKPIVAMTAAPPAAPSPTRSAVSANATDMNTLAPEFGAWLLKNPELNDRMEKLHQSIQGLCASIDAICHDPQARRLDAAGACKNRPPQCTQ